MTIQEDLLAFTAETTTITIRPYERAPEWPVDSGTLQRQVDEMRPYTSITFNDTGVIVANTDQAQFIPWSQIVRLKHVPLPTEES